MLRLYMTELLWAVIPPLLLLIYYYYRTPTAPSLTRVLLFFIFGTVSGLLSLGLEWVFENVANSVVDWQKIQRSFAGNALRQLLEVGSIEEGCKFVAVIAPIYYLRRRYRLRPSTVFLFTIAVAIGFTAEENWVYLFYGTASIFERVISTPVHAMFSATWGYALGIAFWLHTNSYQDRKLVLGAWLNSVICHALVNIVSSTGGYPPLHLLSYGLFPFLLWMFWRLEQLLQKLLGKPPITLISGNTPSQRYWQKGLVLFALMLGGNALFGIFLLVESMSLLSHQQLFQIRVLSFILSRLLLNVFFGFLAWIIYRYLRQLARHRFL